MTKTAFITPIRHKILIHKLSRYIPELQSVRYLLLDNKNRNEILKITNIDIDILEKQLENF